MMREIENPWFSPDRPAALIPPPTTPGSPPPPLPDPPDPLLLHPSDHFPTLHSTIVSPPLTKKQIARSFGTASSAQVETNTLTTGATPMAQDSPITTNCPPSESSVPSTAVANPHDSFQGFTVHIPKKSIPFPTTANPSSSNLPPKTTKTSLKSKPSTSNRILLPPSPHHSRNPPTQNQNHETPPPQTQSYAQKVKVSANKTLQRLAPLSFSEAGVPQVTIPDEVFQRGAELHKDFIQGFFFAKMPSYQALQSVLNFMWGKGTKLDIRTNPKARSFLVRIPNDYIRAKVLEKKIWYVGTAMFQVSSWNTSIAESAPVSLPTSIPLWAHLTGLPLDLRGLEGLSFAAGLIGDPIETDEFTKNLTDLDLAHVKIEADLSKPLPALIELRRINGEIIPVEVTYPWIPPTCSHCKALGHIMKDCLLATPVWVEKQHNSSKQKSTVESPAKKSENNPPPTDKTAPAVVDDMTAVGNIAEAINDSSPQTQTEPTLNPHIESSPTVSALALADQQTFENDLHEIMSVDHPTLPNQNSCPLASGLVFSAQPDPDPTLFLPANHSKRPPPPKLKSSLKRPPNSSPPSINLFNPFSLLDTTQNKASKLTEFSDPSNLSKFSFSAFSPSPPKLPLTLPPPSKPTADEPLDPLEEAPLQSL
ncbi:unnamed protein product [Brassica rapa]|uniref:DUF4283 domain-containing protein n=1 Tax=Brassica campestris TaxID=3711 RepID=A0A3P6BHM6_BRACM|nr:unnamed protein product [Brassica rapa]VDD01836.1 unnamed protein product [Brassica rapa]